MYDSAHLGHADGRVVEALLHDSDAHRVLALLALQQHRVPVEDAQLSE